MGKRKAALDEKDVPLPTWQRGWHVLLDRHWQHCDYLPDNLSQQEGQGWVFGHETYYYHLNPDYKKDDPESKPTVLLISTLTWLRNLALKCKRS